MKEQNPSRKVFSKKLTLDRETLQHLSYEDSARINGGMRPSWWSELDGCSLGNPCTSGCTGGSLRCAPPSFVC